MANKFEERTRVMINGVLLTRQETMTLRVALECFMIELEGDLCKDSGQPLSVTDMYRTHAGTIARKLHDTSRNVLTNDNCPAREECNADQVCIYRCSVDGKKAALDAYSKSKTKL